MLMFLMFKDICVLHVDNGVINVFDKVHLPFVLKKDKVTYDDIYGNFLPYRALSISRTNAKELLNGLDISQINPVKICLKSHSVSLQDCYWTKDDNEIITWHEVNPYTNLIDKKIASIAFSGLNMKVSAHRLHSPELSTQGVSAKCWNRCNGNIYMYKVAKKELAASKILDLLNIDHVKYEDVTQSELDMITDSSRRETIKKSNEKCVKSQLITNENISIMSFEEYAVYCENNNENPYVNILKQYKKSYYDMILADYLLNNNDRHTGNWGLMYNADTMKIIGLYPLMDHDHAFDNSTNIFTQTMDDDILMEDAALIAQQYLNIPLETLLSSKKPEEITDMEWKAVVNRVSDLINKKRCNNTF